MKNKKVTYLLILVVLIVWGLIIYRIFQSVGDNESVEIITAPAKKEVYNDFEIRRDTTHLMLNYRDPFGLTKQKDTSNVKVGTALIKNRNVIKPAINWGFIKYSGYVRNPGTKKLIAIVKINGKSIMMSEGETMEKVKLIRNMRDSIKVGFSGATKFIKIHSAAL